MQVDKVNLLSYDFVGANPTTPKVKWLKKEHNRKFNEQKICKIRKRFMLSEIYIL